MTHEANLQLLVIGSTVVFCWLMLRLVRFIKTQRINTELWCTIFEGLTQGAIRLDDLKAPESVIEKKIRRDGKDKEAFDLEEACSQAAQNSRSQNKSEP
jgi:biopolymer transport protein ExbB/TolQ